MSNIKEVFELIGERYLDVTHSKEGVEIIESRLKELNVSWSYRWCMEIFAAGGLWWNIFWWEWISLDLSDMIYGWILNFIMGLVIFLFMWFLLSVTVGVLCVFLFLVFGVYMGLQLREGSKEK